MEGSERTELFAHLPHTYGRFGQLGSQTSTKFFFVLVIVNGLVHAQLMWPFFSCLGFLHTLRPEPICQGGTIIEMGVNETRRSRRLLHTRWEM